LEAQGEIIAYTDDDVVVDPRWVKGLAQVFAENSEVMAVTGLVVPYELESESQILFETYGGFGRGFERKWYQKAGDKIPWQWFGAGQFGTGANMAYRRCIFETIGFFDPALDVGTLTNGGGDLEMFIRVLKAGHKLVYEPKALIRHRHRREYEKLRKQISYNGIGLYALFTCLAIAYPDERPNIFYIGFWWIGWWHIRRLVLSWIYPQQFPRDLILAEFQGVFQHFGRYQQAKFNAVAIAQQYTSEPAFPLPVITQGSKSPSNDLKYCAIRSIDLSKRIDDLVDIAEYENVRLFILWQEQNFGYLDIANFGQSLSRSKLIEIIAPTYGLKFIEASQKLSAESTWAVISKCIAHRYIPLALHIDELEPLHSQISVSVVVATYDRPDDLRNCLTGLTTQKSHRTIEIIVVDNNPPSGLTAPVVADFPQVTLIQETRKGLSFARNAGILASQGDIIVATDDDVTVPEHWIEALVRPFNRKDVMVVTGNVLPLELETSSQNFFEIYGGLGRGFNRFEVNGTWFESCPYRSVPTWELGATANAAFRASIFRDPEIGLIDEALGAGTPTGCSEDTYIFYKVLKRNYTIVYEPNAFVWHRHRNNLKAFRKQIYNYSKGHVAYHLTTLLNDGDFRALARLLVGLPLIHLYRIYAALRGWSNYPISFIVLETVGNLAGPWSLWVSRKRANRLGRSQFPLPTQPSAVSDSVIGVEYSSIQSTKAQVNLDSSNIPSLANSVGDKE